MTRWVLGFGKNRPTKLMQQGTGPVKVEGMDAVIIIPARFASTRFPGKPLADLAGRPMIEWVWRAAKEVSPQVPVWVATEDARIVRAVEGFGGRAVMTSTDHVSGTDRILEAYEKIGEGRRWVVNWQGDEPLFPPAPLREALRDLDGDFGEAVKVLSFSTPFVSGDEFASPDAVKVIVDARGDSIYFSRHEIPYSREPFAVKPVGERLVEKHLGLYVYRNDTLKQWRELPRSGLESAESLEQLRLLSQGLKVRLRSIHYEGIGVDRPDQAEWVSRILSARKERQ